MKQTTKVLGIIPFLRTNNFGITKGRARRYIRRVAAKMESKGIEVKRENCGLAIYSDKVDVFYNTTRKSLVIVKEL